MPVTGGVAIGRSHSSASTTSCVSVEEIHSEILCPVLLLLDYDEASPVFADLLPGEFHDQAVHAAWLRGFDLSDTSTQPSHISHIQLL
jgi:hypothetical protein